MKLIKTIKYILELSDRYRFRVILGLIFNVFKSVSMVGMYVGIFYVISNIENLSFEIVKTAFYIECISVLARFVFQWLVDIYVTAAGFDIFMDYRINIGDKLKKAPMGYFSSVRLGEIQNVLTTVITSIENYGMLSLCNITGAFSMCLIMVVMFFIYSWPIAIFSIIGLAGGMIILKRISVIASSCTRQLEEVQENMISTVMEYTRGISILRSHVKGKEGMEKVFNTFEEKEKVDTHQERNMAGILRLYQMFYKIMGLSMVILSVYLFNRGMLSKSQSIIYMIASFFVYSELESLGDSAFLSMRINNQFEMLNRIMNIPEMSGLNEGIDFENGDIEFCDVDFSYGNGDILKNINFKVKKNSSIAIVGPSGGGKTTLCKLIPRFWDVSSGSIKVAGVDIRDYNYESLVKNISIVFQNVYLFNDTIKGNIAIANSNASDDEICYACKKAGCHEFISNLPDGYDTIVGEGGSTLSGGEKQRISLARAILKDAPIIILDEATASIDPENESKILKAVKELTKNKTVITIAHKLSTIQNSDCIFVLKDGKIIQNGKHEELLKLDGVYKDFTEAIKKSSTWSIAR